MPLNMQSRLSLGNCRRCQNQLAIIQRPKYRLQGDQRIRLTEDGQDLRQDSQGRTNGKPALEWVITCSDCGLEHRDHPKQREIEQAAAAQRAAADSPPPPAFMNPREHELTAIDLLDRRIGAVEEKLQGQLAEIKAQLASLLELHTVAERKKKG